MCVRRCAQDMFHTLADVCTAGRGIVRLCAWNLGACWIRWRGPAKVVCVEEKDGSPYIY